MSNNSDFDDYFERLELEDRIKSLEAENQRLKNSVVEGVVPQDPLNNDSELARLREENIRLKEQIEAEQMISHQRYDCYDIRIICVLYNSCCSSHHLKYPQASKTAGAARGRCEEASSQFHTRLGEEGSPERPRSSIVRAAPSSHRWLLPF